MRLLLITSVLFCIIVDTVSGQSIDYNRIIVPNGIENIDISEKLVQLAWNNNPANRIVEITTSVQKKNITLTKSNWLSLFSVQYNLVSDQRYDNIDGNPYFPKWNLRLRVPFDAFLAYPTQTSMAKLEYNIGIEELKSRKLAVRSEVLRNYYNYVLAKEILEIKSQFSEEAYSNYIFNEQRFKIGDILIEEYNQSLNDYLNKKTELIISKTNYEIAKINLEEIIGLDLDDILMK